MGRTETVAVVGGGVIGCAVAQELAPDNEVTLYERERVPGGATARAAGTVTPLESDADRPALARHAVEFFRAYDGTGDFRYTERPSVGLVPPDREAEKRAYAARLADDGLPVRFLDPAAAARVYPRFDLAGTAGLVEHEVAGVVDPTTFAETLRDDAERRGATVRERTPVHDLRVEDGRVIGLVTEAGAEEADHLVVAAGWRSRRFLREYVRLPIQPYRSQCVVLSPDEPLTEAFPLGWLPGDGLYFRPLDGDLLVGGWATTVDDPADASRDADRAFGEHVAERVPTFLNGFDGAGLVGSWAGLDGATPDGRPIVDAPETAPDGLVVASGFHGCGVMTAPVAATTVRELLGGDTAPFSTGTFELGRFDDRPTDGPLFGGGGDA